MSQCAVRVTNATAQADIDNARDAADSPDAVDDYRTAMIDAMAARDAGQDPASILRALWRGAYIAGYLAATSDNREQLSRAQFEAMTLDTLLELTGSKR